MSRSNESVSQSSSSKRARAGRMIAAPVLATAVALTASACSGSGEKPAPKPTAASPRPSSAGLAPDLQRRAVTSVAGLARTASLAVLGEMDQPNVGTRSFTYQGDKVLSNKAAILGPGSDGKLGTLDDTSTPGHEHTPEMVARYYRDAHRLFISSTGVVPQNGHETFSSVDVVYEVGEASSIAHQAGLLSLAAVERAVRSGDSLKVIAMSASNRWDYDERSKKTVGDQSGIVFDSGKFYKNDLGGSVSVAADPNWIPLPYDQITAPDDLVAKIDTLDTDVAPALSDLNYLSENVLPPALPEMPYETPKAS